jgi:hypothetical protein
MTTVMKNLAKGVSFIVSFPYMVFWG